MRMRTSLVTLCILLPSVAAAQESLNVKGRNGEAIIVSEQQRNWTYDSRYHYSPAYRAGDFVFFSGVVAGARGEKPMGKEEFQADLRRQFQSLGATLAAAGASFEDVVKMRTFHVFDSPYVTLDKLQQVEAVAQVKGEFIGEPHPAWTAVGTTALLPDRGLVEIEIVAYSPLQRSED